MGLRRSFSVVPLSDVLSRISEPFSFAPGDMLVYDRSKKTKYHWQIDYEAYTYGIAAVKNQSILTLHIILQASFTAPLVLCTEMQVVVLLQITFVNHPIKRTEDLHDVAKMLETSFTCHRK